MAEGKVIKLNHDGNSGLIAPDGGGKWVYFQFKWVKDRPSGGIKEGMRLAFESEEGQKGPRTKWVRYVGGSEQTESPSEQNQESSYRFLNPYNFVRWIPSPTKEKTNGKPATALSSALRAAGVETSATENIKKEELDLLGKCPPPPHDRWVGLSGRITCHVTTETPLFVSDSEDIRVHNESPDHKIYRQFEYNGKPAIPASSLRGMIRNVFETITNSCFAHFDGKRRLSYHLPASEAPYLVPARMVLIDERNDQWQLAPLTGETPLVIQQRPNGPQYAAWVHVYEPPLSGKDSKVKYPGKDGYGSRNIISLSGYRHRDKASARLRKYKHPRANFEFWNVEEIAKTPTALQEPAPGEMISEGYLCLTNQNIERKHDERFFFRLPTNKTGPLAIDMPQEVRDAYRDLIQDYRLRHEDEIKRLGEKAASKADADEKRSAFSRFIVKTEEPKLSDGDLIYAWLEGPVNNPRVKFIAPVSVPRVAYERRIGDLIPEKDRALLDKCSSSEELCPACRVFGWVEGEKQSGQKIQTAFAGRLRFHHARWLNGPAPLSQETLPILSTPKPTTTRFYLAGSDGQPNRVLNLNGVEGTPLTEKEAGYDGYDRQIRGRKFYRHHGRGIFSNGAIERNNQNRSIRGALPKDTEFEFDLVFENLAPLELGALLWALEMPNPIDTTQPLFHRLGYGKPLGMGSLYLKVQTLLQLKPQERYRSLEENGWVDVPREEWLALRVKFEEVLAGKNGAQNFSELPNVRDLKALLSTPPNDLPIHYPRPTEQPEPKNHPSYEWFVGNKRDKGPKFELPLAEDDTIGLPLVDKESNWH